MTFCWIPAGEFWMGAAEGEKHAGENEVQHHVRLTRGFWLGKHEVTQAKYKAITGQTPSKFKGDDLPVETVSWDDAKQFFAKVNESGTKPKGYEKYAFGLPTEAQWEYACRGEAKGGKKTTPFQWGGVLNGDKANCDGRHPSGTDTKGKYLEKTTPVGTYTKAAAPRGG